MTVFWMVLLYVGGLFLILAEAILPGAICGIIGFALVCASVAMNITHFEGGAAFAIALAQLLGAVGAVIASMLILAKTRAASFLTLEASQRPEAGFVNMQSDTGLIGVTGSVLTPLRPAGTILIGERRMDAVAQGQLIDKGATVRVIEVHGNRVVVEPAE